MTTASQVLATAAAEIGYCRWNDPEAGTKYGRWYAQRVGSRYYGESGVPYCAMFVSWVLCRCGYDFTYAYCPYILRDYASRAVAKHLSQPGDIVLFDWGSDGVPDHVGLVEANRGSYIQTIEGNTSRGTGGSQGNGGWVARRTRSLSVVRAIVRPSYGGQAAPAPSAPGQLAVDGFWGRDTTSRAQQLAGTPVDGEVWHQPSAWRSRFPGCTGGWRWDGTGEGSPLIRHLQGLMGIEADGLAGPDFANAFIRRYGNGITDGRLDEASPAIMGFQRSLNAGRL